ncbi:SIR2 family protein [Stenotrophomonas maltophilia]|uniref:SIR2 family protein n=1 Tax=Stenotrophomonas maltophilia TaxID=40324 RepID=UPI001B30DF39|nr:SIR2 family protein [Stenotrophomonas maltophilia]
MAFATLTCIEREGMSIKAELSNLFGSRSSGPFLFLGSGFSRRYLGLEDWKGLLQRFCGPDRPFERYLATANSDYPLAAKAVARDFNERWWTEPGYEESRSINKDRIHSESSALRIEICKYLSNLNLQLAMSSDFKEEVEMLTRLNVDGVITTNWDGLIEEIFPGYKVYVGQNELLFSSPQEIGEIYKIHGSCSEPSSLMLTSDDYDLFASQNVYLAAKLITVFVEHPVVFIGYSLSDINIKSLLRSISLCIGPGNVDRLRKNLIFVQRPEPGDSDSVSETYFTIDGVQIPMVLVRTNDFGLVYSAIESTKRKIPARVLRFCKEQMYEVIKSSDPGAKLCVVDMESISDYSEIEFVVGVGVVSKGLSAVGYTSITALDLFSDLLIKDRSYDAESILRTVIKSAGKNSPNVPVFKYLRAVGVKSLAEYNKSDFKLDKWVVRPIRDYRASDYYQRGFKSKCKGMDSSQIISTFSPEHAAAYIGFLSVDKIDLGGLGAFLADNFETMRNANSTYASYFRKLAAYYDKLRWGW